VIERGPLLSKQDGQLHNSAESPRLRAWWQPAVSRSSTVSTLNLRLIAQNDIQQ
jgi:hypothetical protein